MLVRAPNLEWTADEAVLITSLEPAARAVTPRELRIGVPRDLGEWLDRSGTPFVPLATVFATAIGEDVRFEAPISPRIAHGAELASAKFSSWWGYRAARVTGPRADESPPGSCVAALYSGGVDTSATLLRSLRSEIPERATHLLSMYGSEFKLSPRTQAELWRLRIAAAAEYGLPLIRVTTNAPAALRGVIGWPRSHGACFASLALSLGPRFRTVLVGSTQVPQQERPHGSRPDLDPLWSTGRTRIDHDAAELGKVGRAAIVATSQTALSHLQVCWETDSARNCGRCEKCLRVMTALAVAGALERTDRFDAPLTIEAIRRCKPNRGSVVQIAELVERIPEQHPALRAAWRDKLREAHAWHKRQRRRAAVERVSLPVRRGARRGRRRLLRARRRIARRLGAARSRA